MALDAKAGFSGLVTATAEVGGAPTGLRIADNVTLRKEGALMPRPVFSSTALSRTYRAAFPYRGVLYYIGPSNTFYDSTQTLLTPVIFSGNPAIRDDVQSAREARGNLYFASATGVYKVASVGSALERSGLLATDTSPYGLNLLGTGTPLLLLNNQQVAYRLVAKRTDINGVVLRSRPTGAYLVTNASGVSATPQLTVELRTGAVVDEVEVYRTRVFPTTAQVDDEMQLVTTISASQFSAGSPRLYTFTDRVLDAARGTTLYTSPSRGGIENANDRPPGCACLERFRGSMFFGNVRGPQRLVFSYRYSPGNLAGQATGIGRRTVTGNTTNGGTSITAISNTVGLQVGMGVQGPGVSGTVTALAGTTATISNAATAGGTGVSITFLDVVRYTPYGSAYSAVPAASATDTPLSYGLKGGGIYTTAYDVTPAAPGYDATVVLETTERGSNAALTVAATHGDEYSPPLPLPTTTYMTPPAESTPHGLAWSEPDEPEHVPPKNFARVGDAGKAILGLVATKDRLLIFKEDGLYMLTGSTARDFSIYPLDTTCLCILPGSIRRLKNTVYVLTNLGLVAVDEAGGVTVVSRPIQLEVAVIVNAIRTAQKSSGLYLMPGLSGVTGAGDDAQGEYHLALGSSTPSFGGQVLVYSLPRDGFTTFSFGTPAPVALATDGEGNPLVLTASSLLTPSTALGPVNARVSPRAFCDPALVGKLWTHIVAGFSQLTGTTSVSAKFTSSESQDANASVTEAFESAPVAGLIQLPGGSLLRHPIPRAVTRAYLLFVELLINVASGTFTLETIAAESRENASNKRPTHGTGAT